MDQETIDKISQDYRSNRDYTSKLLTPAREQITQEAFNRQAKITINLVLAALKFNEEYDEIERARAKARLMVLELELEKENNEGQEPIDGNPIGN